MSLVFKKVVLTLLILLLISNCCCLNQDVPPSSGNDQVDTFADIIEIGTGPLIDI